MRSVPSLALLVPAFNAEHCLPKLLHSADQQSTKFDEIWVYDDCSTDRTAEVAEALGARVVRGAANRGCTYAKSVLAERTSCDWMHFHDADDLLLPGMVRAAHHWMTSDAEVVVFGCEERWADTNAFNSVAVPDDAQISRDPIRYNIHYKVNSQSGLYRRSAFLKAGGFDLDPEVLYNEDQAFHLKLARAGLRFRADPHVYSTYYKNRVSMSNSNPARCLRAHLHVMLKAIGHESGERNADLIAGNLWGVSAGSAAQQDWQTACQAATLAYQLSKGHGQKRFFKIVCAVSPKLAVFLRELAIRVLKPSLRKGFPRWRMLCLISQR